MLKDSLKQQQPSLLQTNISCLINIDFESLWCTWSDWGVNHYMQYDLGLQIDDRELEGFPMKIIWGRDFLSTK